MFFACKEKALVWMTDIFNGVWKDYLCEIWGFDITLESVSMYWGYLDWKCYVWAAV